MQLKHPLIPGRLIKRYKRFLADIELDSGDVITAHCANPGSMQGLNEPGLEVWLSHHENTKRKLPYSWELARVDGKLVGINTGHPNKIVEEAIRAGRIPELEGYSDLRREVRYGENSRVDILLEDAARGRCYVEVKNVHLKRKPALAEFPDAVTARGLKHLRELSHVVQDGHRAVMLFLVQRQDCRRFAIADDIDPAYSQGFEDAQASGVEAYCYSCHITTESISLAKPLAIVRL